MGSIKENQNQAEEPWYVLREMPEKEGESSLELYESYQWNGIESYVVDFGFVHFSEMHCHMISKIFRHS